MFQASVQCGVLDARNLVQNKEPVNFGADEYDGEYIRASAVTLSQLVAGMQAANPTPKTKQ